MDYNMYEEMRQEAYDAERYADFKVIGAGTIIVGRTAESSCGGKKGFSIGVEWGQHGYAGGVIPRDEAIKLAKHILRITNLETLSDESENNKM